MDAANKIIVLGKCPKCGDKKQAHVDEGTSCFKWMDRFSFCRPCGYSGSAWEFVENPEGVFIMVSGKEDLRLIVTKNGMFIIDNIAIPQVKMPPKEYPDEIFPDDIQEAMKYYRMYSRLVIHQNIKPFTPQEYLMSIIGKLGKTSEIREQILSDWMKHYGARNTALMLGATQEDVEFLPTPEQELFAMLSKKELV